MEPFSKHRGVVATLDRANVDTDQIIPKQFLKSIKRTGFEAGLFIDWRLLPDGSPDPAFDLNREAFRHASVLVARNNFGCGSSREHAVWAVMQGGFRVVIAPEVQRGGQTVAAFADIFANNAVKNGLLTVALQETEVEILFQQTAASPGLEATVDLEAQRVTLHTVPEQHFAFEIDPSVKEHLLLGLDDIALTLAEEDAISTYEAHHPDLTPID